MTDAYTAIRDRLDEEGRCPALLQVVTGMSIDSVEAMTIGPIVSALVVPLSDTAPPPGSAALKVSQFELEIVGVVLALTYPGGFEQFVPGRDQIKAALRGWFPSWAAEPITYAGGQTLQYTAGQDGGRWLHLLRFRVSTQHTYEVQD